MGSGFTLSGWFGKSRPAPATAPGAQLETVALRPLRRRPWKLRAAVACAAAVALLFVAFALYRQADRKRRLAEADAMCPLVQTNSVSDRALFPTGLPPHRKFWVAEGRKRETTVREALVELGARVEAGKVVGRDGRELYFYYFSDSRGRSEVQREEIEALEAKGFRVVVMYGRRREF
jgi:hypothetical protein